MRSILGAVAAVVFLLDSSIAAPPNYTAKSDDKPPRLTNDAWKDVAKTTLHAVEIDQLIAKEQAAEKIAPSPPTTDEQFLRRVMLDLTGRLPLPADVTEFAADKDPDKRAKIIDKLLASDEYA